MIILDTNILMAAKKLSHLENSLKTTFPEEKDFCVTIGTLLELDRLKSAEGQRGFEARNGLRLLRESTMITVFDTNNPQRPTLDESTVDGDIIRLAKLTGSKIMTNDLSMSSIAMANGVAQDRLFEYRPGKESYSKGYHVLNAEDYHLADSFEVAFEFLDKGNGKIGEYLVITRYSAVEAIYQINKNHAVDRVFSNSNRKIRISSKEFGCIEPKKNDIAQLLAFDMVGKKPISLLTGPAGSGKTLIMLAKQFEMLEKGEIQKITVFVNPEKTRGAKTLGFYKGDRNLKLMQESIGGILASKLAAQGGPLYVEQLIEDNIIEILPVSDIRGYEVSAYSSLYITEAQNLNKDLMQLAIQRAAEGCKIFVEGDPATQLDSWAYEGDNNGMLKLIEVFSDSDLFCSINLDKIYRSPVADLAENMTK